MADFLKPDSASNYSTEFFQQLNEKLDALAKLNFTGFTGLVTDAIAWSATNGRLEQWNGTSWVELIATYMINVDRLGGQQGSYYRDASNMNAGTLPGGRFNDTSHGNRGGGSQHAAATASASGFMTAALFNKLAGIESGATADLSAAEILALLLTVDGAGSGLDADFLQGNAPSAFAAAGHVGATGAAHGEATGSVAGFMSAAHFTKLDALTQGDSVSMLQGTIAHGGTIPLPSGYTEGQCRWIVSPYDVHSGSG